MTEVQHIHITSETADQRVDNYLIRILKGVPKSLIYRIIREGQVRVNKKRVKPHTRLLAGDILRVPPIRTAAVETKPQAQKYAFMLDYILHEDESILVLNKPPHIAVHGGSGVSLGVIEALRLLRSDIKYLELVHRLDKETSGCLLLAKKRSVLKTLQAGFQSKTIQKTYLALLSHPWHGSPKRTVNAPLKKYVQSAGERIVRIHEEGKASETRFQLLENFKTCCLVNAMPLTGRTHQIRVHSMAIDHPIVGDEKYQAKQDVMIGKVKRLCLHAQSIQFTLNEQTFCFEAPLSGEFLAILNRLRSL